MNILRQNRHFHAWKFIFMHENVTLMHETLCTGEMRLGRTGKMSSQNEVVHTLKVLSQCIRYEFEWENNFQNNLQLYHLTMHPHGFGFRLYLKFEFPNY